MREPAASSNLRKTVVNLVPLDVQLTTQTGHPTLDQSYTQHLCSRSLT